MILTKDEFVRFKTGALLTQDEFPQIVSPTACYYGDQLIAIYGPHPVKKRLIKTNKKCFRKERRMQTIELSHPYAKECIIQEPIVLSFRIL